MKKINTNFSVELKRIKLYLDDLEKLNELLREYFDMYSIKIDDYILDSFDEINKLQLKNNVTNKLEITTKNPSIYITLNENHATINEGYDNTDHERAIGIIIKIKELLKPSTSIINKYNVVLLIWIPIAVITQIILSKFLLNYALSSALAIIFNFIILLLIILIDFNYKIIKHSKIYLFNRKDKDTFFKRNGDKIIIAVISFFMGIASTVIGQLILIKYFNITI